MGAKVRWIATWVAVATTCVAILIAPVWSGAVDASEEGSNWFEFPGGATGAKAGRDPCRPGFIESSVREFFTAINSGGRDAIESAIAPGAKFRVYSQTQRYGTANGGFFSSKDREEVVRHLAKRQARGDRYRVRIPGLDANGYDRAFELCNLGYVIDRRIGGGPWQPFVGKGALDWPSGAVSVWNIGGQCGPPGSGLLQCPDS